jgi:hypothetical protein
MSSNPDVMRVSEAKRASPSAMPTDDGQLAFILTEVDRRKNMEGFDASVFLRRNEPGGLGGDGLALTA